MTDLLLQKPFERSLSESSGFRQRVFFVTVWGYNGKTLNCLVPVDLKAREVLYKLKIARFAFFSQIRFLKRAMGERGRTYKSKIAIYNMNDKEFKQWLKKEKSKSPTKIKKQWKTNYKIIKRTPGLWKIPDNF